MRVPPFAYWLVPLIVVLDQATKILVRHLLPYKEAVSVFGNWIRWYYTTNTGAGFSIFYNQTLFLTIVSLLILGFLIYYYPRLPRQLLVQTAIFLIVGGSIGNLIDRIVLGRVTDFVDLGVGGLRWPTFNIADSAICIAAILIVVYWMFYEKRTIDKK